MPKDLRMYSKDQLSYYVFVSILFITGVIFGAVMVNALTLEQKQEIVRHLGHFFHTIDTGAEGDVAAKQTFFQAVSLNLKWVALIWILGLSVIGLPFIFALDFIKGVLIGFSVGFMVGQFSWKGMLFALTSIAPQNMVLIPVIVAASVAAMSFSIQLVKNRFIQRTGSVYPLFIKYSTTTLTLALAVVIVSLFEAYVSPIMMKWVTPYLISLAELPEKIVSLL
ncbi:stage II sporulation protein M [Paenibacillus sp. J2TS4]|uniref:stage II sporulation protein M n=1 Tax=Paenibacillus sp. J2TS4 TaxID=2807194 RepID=UPI001B2B0F5F|nr:stage II sporulation protein M [Paenibacillus sp. J2TS4]GIP32304.1 stage II sporulation protein M [Paenibacillus sp. J2TS4]